MLKFLTTLGSKSLHPLTNVEAVTRWMDSLPLGDSVKAITALTKQIKEYNDRPIAADKERVAVLSTLDQAAQELLEILRQQYLQNPRMSRAVESRLWNAVSLYYQEILRAYHSHIMEYIGNPSSSKIAANIPLLTARALCYFGLDAKWSYYRYTRVNSKLWKRMHNLYHFAEYEEFETRALKLYEAEDETSILKLYLQSLMLETLNTGSLTPRQIYLVERWLPMLVQGIRLESTHKPGHHVFYVNLEENRGARRVRRIIPSETFRYWDSSGLKDKLDALRSQLSAGVVPAKLGLTEDCKLPTCLELLERIADYWSPIGLKRTQRASKRLDTMKSIEVVRGLGDICVNVRADNVQSQRAQGGKVSDGLSYNEMVDVHLYGFITQRTQTKVGQGKKDDKVEHVIVHERWVMENESEAGYGAHINDQADDWVRLGKLVGLKAEKKGHWNIGVIRRLQRTQSNQQYVGIAVIDEHPVTLLLRAEKSEQRPLSVDGLDNVDTLDLKLPFPALYLKGAGSSAQTDALILQSAEFSNGRELWFNARGTIYHIRLKNVLERGDDWLRTSFEVVGKQTIGTDNATGSRAAIG